jgi:hypothetical protein
MDNCQGACSQLTPTSSHEQDPLWKNNHEFQKQFDLQSQAIYVDKTIWKKSTCFSSWCKWRASGDIEQALVKILFKIWLNYVELMIFYKNRWWWPQVYNEIKEYEKEIKFKVVKVIKIISKTKSSHLLLSIDFHDNFKGLIWVFYIWVLKTTIEATMRKKFNLNNILLPLLGVWPK